MTEIFLKRIYEPYEESDGSRVLVDRLWPRGIKKENAHITSWMKEIAPSSELRKWFCHKVELFAEFRSRYLDELRTDEQKIQLVGQLCDMAAQGKLTLLYGAKDPVHNQAVVLREELEQRIAERIKGSVHAPH
jgi:uncharacterized protein YeaO (DUF488 family)